MAKPVQINDDESRDLFLSTPRLAILMTNRREGTPIGVPVWFEWDGNVVRMFAANTSPKVRRLRRDPRASVLVTNRLDEGECWVAFDGEVSISDAGGFELAERLAPRYWDLEDPERRDMLELWRKAQAVLSLLTLKPTLIRTGS
jgi:PPOX class probable F420-dependent enzyme